MRPLVALLALAPLVAGQSQVHVVAPVAGRGIDFVTLQAAVDAAVTGDVILVRPGTYTAGCNIVGKSVYLLADDPAGVGTRPLVEAHKPVFVESTPAGTTLLVRGLDLCGAQDASGAIGSCLFVNGSDGAIALEECVLTLDDSLGATTNSPALVVGDCVGGLLLRNCTLRGKDGYYAQIGPFGGSVGGTAGLTVNDTEVHAYGSSIEGGVGGPGVGTTTPGQKGAPAVRLSGTARLSAQGCTLTAGRGGPGYEGGPGGDCLWANPNPGTDVSARLQDTVLVPGIGGIGIGSPPDGAIASPELTDLVLVPEHGARLLDRSAASRRRNGDGAFRRRETATSRSCSAGATCSSSRSSGATCRSDSPSPRCSSPGSSRPSAARGSRRSRSRCRASAVTTRAGASGRPSS